MVGRFDVVGTSGRVGHSTLEAGEVVDGMPGRVGRSMLHVGEVDRDSFLDCSCYGGYVVAALDSSLDNSLIPCILLGGGSGQDGMSSVGAMLDAVVEEVEAVEWALLGAGLGSAVGLGKDGRRLEHLFLCIRLDIGTALLFGLDGLA